ncbi:MAG: tol-pal system protein YbgF [Nitrospirota bacterium]
MIKRLLSPLLIVSTIITISGCAMQSEFVDLENEVNRMKVILLQAQREVSELQKSQQPQQDDHIAVEIKEQFAKMDSQNTGSIDMLQKNQADFENRFTQLATDVQVIQGSVEENTHRMAELTENSDDHDAAIQEMSRRLDNLEAMKGEEVRKQQEMPVVPAPPGQPTVHSSAVTPPGGVVASTPSELYNQSYKDYMSGNYDLAIEGFYNYLRQLPTGNLAPNALYWIGECYYSKGDYGKAVTVFESVTIDYPKSDKIVSALLKMGYGYEKLNNNDMAKLYFKKVVEQFPYSPEASLAKVRLTDIK